jgi:crotonobetainyl-CoA:carnitine CoA-transferase CaiB-like acyl-CoA transferase
MTGGPSHVPQKPLEGIRVVEVGVWHAGPGAGAILGDLGAEVIKVESLSGDPERSRGDFGPFGIDLNLPPRADWCLLYEISNRNKRGLCLDVGTKSGLEILHTLLADADVFLTNLRASTKERLGIDYDTLRADHPRLIHVSVSGYGPEGPMADLGGFDPTGQAVSGMMFLSGLDEPRPLQVIVLDQMTAITASHAVITALLAREKHGIAQEAHVSMYGSALWLMYGNMVKTGVSGKEVDISWDRTQNPYTRTTFRCGDNKWLMVANHDEDRFWSPFCVALGCEELIDDPRFNSIELRRARNAEIIELFDARFALRTRAEWLIRLRQHQIVVAPVNSLGDVVQDEQAIANGYVTTMDHPFLGSIAVPGYPVHFSAQEAGWSTAAPGLGEHSRDILAESGYSPDQIEAMVRDNVLK